VILHRYFPAALACLAAALLLGCDGDEGESPDRGSPSPPPATTSPPTGRGLAPSNQQEMQDLLARTLHALHRPVGRPSCVAASELSPSATRYSCRAAGSTYRIDWEHYGTGAYVISRLDEAGRARRITRGTLTISE
jgi:hypothetical protein